MLNLRTTPLIFYPAYCFPLSPTYNSWAHLTAIDVHALRERLGFEGQNLYFHLNHPIKWVRLVGLIVSFELVSNRFILTLDDFSGTTIELNCGRKAPPLPPIQTTSSGTQTPEALEHLNDFRPDGSVHVTKNDTLPKEAGLKGITAKGHEVDLSSVDIGSIVKVKGGIGEFRDQKQILLERICVVKSTTDEAKAWAENLEFRRDVLAKPWVVGEEEMKSARREADGLGRDGKTRRRKKVKRLRSGTKGAKCYVKSAVMKKKIRNESYRRADDNECRQRKEAEQTWIVEQEMKLREEEERRRIELEGAQRRERREAARKMKEEQERKRREEEEKKRKAAEEGERLATERRLRSEAREEALRQLGAGR